MTVTVERGDTATVQTTVSDVDDVDALVRTIEAAEADLLELDDEVDLERLTSLSFEFETRDGEPLEFISYSEGAPPGFQSMLDVFDDACTSRRFRERTAAFLETFLECLDTAFEYGTFLRKDSESPTLLWAAYRLALAAELYLPLYARFIEQTDMDHEVSQWGQIDDLIDEHGWTDGIETLLAVRATTAAGQHGIEQLERRADFIREHASSPLYESSLFEAFLAHYRTDPDDGWMRTLAEMHGQALLDEDEQDGWMARVDRELAS